MTSKIPYAKFSTEPVEDSQKRDVWVEGMKGMYDSVPIEKDNTLFKGSLEVWDVDGLFFGTVDFDPQIIGHSRSTHNALGEHDFVFMTIIRQGGLKSIHDGKPTEHHLDEVHLFDFSLDGRAVASVHTKIEAVILPYGEIGYEPGRHAAEIIFPYTKSTGYVLNNLSAMILEKLPKADLEEAKIMAGMLTGSIRNLISDDADETARGQAAAGRRAVMQRFIVENIDDLSLSVETLCRKFEVSRATVFRDFEPGGLQHFLMLHRLDRALNDIASGPAMRGRIALIANQWGFGSPAHFSRTFREHFGFSPSDAAGAGREARRAAAQQSDGDIHRDWMLWAQR